MSSDPEAHAMTDLDPIPQEAPSEAPPAPRALTRRSFLGSGLGATAALTAGGVALPALTGARAAAASTTTPAERKDMAFRMRHTPAHANYLLPPADHPTNGDEELYPEKLGNFSKGLSHDAAGEVDPAAYSAFLAACQAAEYAAFEGLPPGEPNPAQRRRLVNPLAGVAYDLEGIDSHEYTMRPPPTFASAEEAGEIVENYWMALLRDVPFSEYATHPLALEASHELSTLSDFRGPREGGLVTPRTLFREDLPGALVGPWVSQFFWRSQPFGSQAIEPRMRTVVPGGDFMTSAAEWLAVQNGTEPSASLVHDPVLRYLRNGRDIGEWVHVDVLYQAYFQAALHLLTPPDPTDPFTGGGLGLDLNPGNPYHGSTMQEGFGTFGGPYLMTILTEVATRALKAVWYQKWFLHRRLRPEVFAGRVHFHLTGARTYPLHPDVLHAQAPQRVFSQHGTYFLPMAFPEGSPLHPAYGAGHGTVAGACVTILKALFDTRVPFPAPVVAAPDGLSVGPYTAPDAGRMTVEGELNKLAYNVALGRNVAGVHWRSDGIESLRLGEEVALSILHEQRPCYGEPFTGFTLRRFDGSSITI